MLRLAQKKITAEQYDFWAALFFVALFHLALVLLAARNSNHETVSLALRMARAHKAIIVWHATPVVSQSRRSTTAKVKKAKPAAPAKKVAPKSAAKHPFSLSKPATKKIKPKVVSAPPTPAKPARVEPAADEPVVKKEKKDTVAPVAPEEPIVMNIHDYDKHHDRWEIIEAVQRGWQPPLGVDETVQCVINVTFTSQGAIQELVVQKSSGIPIYDIAAKTALLKAVFSKKVWGKQWVFYF